METNYSVTFHDNESNRLRLKCTLCNKICDTHDTLEAHNQSKDHMKKLKNKNSAISLCESNDSTSFKSTPQLASFGFFCQICKVGCNTKDQLEKHNEGKLHKKKALKVEFKDFNTPESSLSTATKVATESVIPASIPMVKEVMTADLPTSACDVKIIEKSVKTLAICPEIQNRLQPIRQPNWITCQLCNTGTNTEEQYIAHCNGGKHQKRLKSLNIAPEASVQAINDDQYVACAVCNIMIQKNNIESHNNGKSHKEKLVKSKCVDNTIAIRLVHKTDLSPDLINGDLLKLEPRGYQKEIYKKALVDDCVVFLPTGTGKTFIAAMLILKMLEENPFHRVVFLVDKVLLVMQQCDFLKEQLDAIKLTRFISQEDKTETRELRFLGIANNLVDTKHGCSIRDHDVIVATADLFRNSLNKPQLLWSDLSLVILDEAHHTVKEHPYNRLLNEYHLFPKHVQISNSNASFTESVSNPVIDQMQLERWKLQRCKIIGLTASPAGDLDEEFTYQMLETLLQSLGDVSIVSVTENVEELNEFTCLTNIETKQISYGPKELELRGVISNAFIFLLRKYERIVNGVGNGFVPNNSLSIEDVGNLKNQLCNFLADMRDINKTVLNHILSLVDIIDAIDSIGYKLALQKFTDLTENANEMVWFDNNVFNFKETSKRFISADPVTETSSIVDMIIKECNTIEEGNRTILLLVKERKIAVEFQRILMISCNKYQVILLVGHGGKGTKSKTKGMSVNKQKKALDGIREMKNQIIIATSVADEGIDLPECDLVIIVNPPNSVQALVQIRGRARKKSSRLVMLCRDQQSIDSLERLKIQEKNIEQAIKRISSKTNGSC